jgi:hypothetical protein
MNKLKEIMDMIQSYGNHCTDVGYYTNPENREFHREMAENLYKNIEDHIKVLISALTPGDN